MRFFILFSLAILVYADVPGCPNGLMSFNYSKLPVVFPSGGDLQTFPDFYNCQLQISVPLGYFAIFTLDVNSANPGKNAPVQVIDQTNQTENVFHSETEEFYLISKGGSINLSTGNSKTQFRVQINWKQYLRGLIFFNGPYWNSTILGTGRQIFDRKSQFVTSAPYNHYLTVLFLGNSAETDIQFVEQLYENTQQFTEIQTLVYNGNITRELTMEASGNGKSIVQTYSSHSIVEGILSIDGTEYLDVYPHEGLKNMSNSIIRYRYNKKPTNGSLEVIGDYCTVSYDTGIGGIHNGSLIRYTVTQPKLTIGLSGIFSFVFVALNVFAFH
ncbi:hypothetical protein B9Z55_026775 [Caenorhabditis nigoni]|uniref:Uncharacterized protein n=1 Tax=Caenorhabditis nigoni TaxID=1611254 RepID=A0A2G5SHV2_9PELO|nr:hypothetical protein B9Z55_026775 [Caenorhabditis nigoni]